jgi:ferredoxin-thioredoxin reductase catalytic subunit
LSFILTTGRGEYEFGDGGEKGQDGMGEKLPDHVRFNEDTGIRDRVLAGLKKTGGYCPCRLKRTPENLCMCLEFREQIADPDFEGYCHCRLYYKEKA